MSNLNSTFDDMFDNIKQCVGDARILGMSFQGHLGEFDARSGKNHLQVCVKGTLSVLTDGNSDQVSDCVLNSGAVIRCGVRDMSLIPSEWIDICRQHQNMQVNCYTVLLPQSQFPELEFVIMQDKLTAEQNTVNYIKELNEYV